MGKWMAQIQFLLEERAFGVCTWIGEKLGIATSTIRLFFIYASFLTLGSPVLIYLILAFILNFPRMLRRRNPVWDY
jgi:phage shock protein PspC (stress-responsive transcriptional regulator)